MFRREDPRNSAAGAEPPEPAPVNPSEVFLGGLASVSSTPRNDLPPRFAALAGAVGDLFEDYRSGEISAAEFADALSTRRITDARGVEWTIGATSGGWFRRDGSGAWRSSLPPTEADDTEEDPLERLLSSVDLSEDPELAALVDPPPTPAVEGTLAAIPEQASDTDDSPLVDAWGEPTEPSFEAADTASVWDDVAEVTVEDVGPDEDPSPAPAGEATAPEVSSPWELPSDTDPATVAVDPIDALGPLLDDAAADTADGHTQAVAEEAAADAGDGHAEAVVDAAPVSSGWDDVEVGSRGVAPRGSGSTVWGSATYDPAADGPDGLSADGISGESRWLNGAADAAGEDPDPLAELLADTADT